MGNDNLSGIVLWALLLRELKSRPTRHSYRAIIVPETIGAIAYLSRHEAEMKRLAGGFVITTVAGPGPFGYKQTFQGNHPIDRAVRRTFAEAKVECIEYPFHIKGSDETHYAAPFFRIPTGTVCKDKYYEYPYYHTSLDDLEFISAENLVRTLEVYLLAIEKIELNRTFRSLSPYSEPMLGKRGLYPSIGGHINQPAVGEITGKNLQAAVGGNHPSGVSQDDMDAMLWLLFYGDGQTPLLDIAEKTQIPMRQLLQVAEALCVQGLLEEVDPTPGAR
jgi:aminopeptidase-like protein